MCLCVSICTNIYPYVPFCTQIYLCTNMFLYNVPYKYTYKTFTKIKPPWYHDSPHDTMPLDTTLYDSPHLSSQRQTEWWFTIGEWQYIDEWCVLQNYTQLHTTLYPTFPPYCNCISNCIQAPTEGKAIPPQPPSSSQLTLQNLSTSNIAANIPTSLNFQYLNLHSNIPQHPILLLIFQNPSISNISTNISQLHQIDQRGFCTPQNLTPYKGPEPHNSTLRP